MIKSHRDYSKRGRGRGAVPGKMPEAEPVKNKRCDKHCSCPRCKVDTYNKSKYA